MYTMHFGTPHDPRPENETSVYRFLDSLHIPFYRIDHGPVHTMEDCAAIDKELGGQICKNLFLSNTQQTEFYLLMIQETKFFKTKDISKQLGVSRLTFGAPEHMERLLHLSPGAVSPMGLHFESAKNVRLIVDADVKKAEFLGCHPCVNTASIRLSMEDFFLRYLPATGHVPTFVTVPQAE